MNQIFAIAAGGAVGALLRFWVATGVYAWLGRDFPYGTLAVNAIGSLLMGFLYVLLIERGGVGVEWRAAILIGLLGSFTTFSTFSIETLELIEEREHDMALLNIALSVTVCLLAVWFGLVMGRKL